MQGLNAVDDGDIGLQSLELFQHQLEICFGKQLKPLALSTQAQPAQLHLLS